MNAEIPRRAERLLDWSLTDAERGAVMGDMQEEFADITQRLGPDAARRWYWRQTIVSVWPNLMRRFHSDVRRRKRCYWGLLKALTGLMGSILVWKPSVIWILGGYYLFEGASDVARGFFQRRPRGRGLREIALMNVWAGVGLAAALLRSVTETGFIRGGAAFRSGAAFWWIYAIGLAACVVIALKRKWPEADLQRCRPTEFFVRPRTNSVFDRTKRYIAVVPNVPLGLSQPILCQAPPAGSTSPRGVPLNEMIFDYTFPPGARVRLYAAAKDLGATTKATVDVIDRNGRVAKTFPATPIAGGLERAAMPLSTSPVPDLLYDESVEPISRRVSEIDVVVDLADLKPGVYDVRLTVQDGAQSSVQQERLVVTDDRGSFPPISEEPFPGNRPPRSFWVQDGW